MNFIDLKAQYTEIKPQIQAAIDKVLEHGKYINGPEVSELEQKLCEFTGVKNCVLLGSGTDALLLPLMYLNLSAEDEIIVPAFSFFGTAEVVSIVKAKPVFVDINPDTYNIDVDKIEKAITSKTKVIMPVGLYGQCPEMNKINSIAAKYNIKVLEDAAQSFGGTYHGKSSCNLTDMAGTSFYPAKPLGAYGDAGAFFSNDNDLAQAVRELKEHGSAKTYHHTRIGLNGRCDSIQAAILLEKLKIFPKELKRRQEAASYYDLKLTPFMKTPIIKEGNTSAYAQYTIEVENRDIIREKLSEQGIPTAVHYPMPMNKQPIYVEMGHGNEDFEFSDSAARRVMSLPMHPYLTEVEQDKVVEALKSLL
jgi:UDP-2-acetamido-2-deoxy-ribo-hexuluronate aminotransferase